jgi:hypothetical protein
MIIDVHRHSAAKDTVQGDYIHGAPKSFAMMSRKTHKVDITDKAFKEREADIPFTDEEINQILGGSAQKVLQM